LKRLLNLVLFLMLAGVPLPAQPGIGWIVGSGNQANAPATCTAYRDIYFATDTVAVGYCLTANTWSFSMSIQGGLTAGAIPFMGANGLSQDATHFAYTSTGALGPYLSVGTTAQVNAQIISFKGTAASHFTETTILGDFNAPFDGINSPFGIQGLVINSGTNGPQNCPGGSCNPFVGHVIGVEGNAQETGNGLLVEIGVEGRADQITSTTAGQQHYTGVLGTSIKSFNGNNVQTMKAIETVLQSCNSQANTFAAGGPNNDLPGGHLVCTSPDAHGTGIAIHVTPIQGFLTKFGLYGEGDPWFNSGPVTSGANSTTVGGLNATASTTGVTITAAQIIQGIFKHSGENAAQTDTTDTAANIVALIPGCTGSATAGQSFTFVYRNLSAANTIVLAGGTNVTFDNGATLTTTVAVNTTREYIGTVTSCGTPAVTLTLVGSQTT